MLWDWAARLLYLGVAVECARQVRSGWGVRGIEKDAHPELFESARKEVAAAHEQARLILLAVLVFDAAPALFGLRRPGRYLPLVACGTAQMLAHAYASLCLRRSTWGQVRAIARVYLRWAAGLAAAAVVFGLMPLALSISSALTSFGPFGRDFVLPALLSGAALLWGALWTLHDVGKPLFARGEDVADEDLRRRHAAAYEGTALAPARLRWLPEPAPNLDSLFDGVRAERFGLRPSLLLNRKCLEKLAPPETDLILRYSAVLDLLDVNARILRRYWAFCAAIFVPGVFLLRVAYASLARGYDPFDVDLPVYAMFAGAAFALDAHQEKRLWPLLVDARVLTRFDVEPAALLALIGRLYAVYGHPLKGLGDVKSPELKARLEQLGRYAKRETEPARWLAAVERRARAARWTLACGMGALLAAAAFGCLRAHRLTSAIRRGDEGRVYALLAGGADPDRPDLLMGGETPMALARRLGRADLAALLKARGPAR